MVTVAGPAGVIIEAPPGKGTRPVGAETVGGWGGAVGVMLAGGGTAGRAVTGDGGGGGAGRGVIEPVGELTSTGVTGAGAPGGE